MAKRSSNKNSNAAKSEDGFDRLARMMKDGFDDLEANLRKEIKDTEGNLEGKLRTEIRESEERLQYRISKVSTDIYRHLDASVEPQMLDHERRIKRLEEARKV